MIDNRTAWRGDDAPNRKVTRLVAHVTLFGPYLAGGEPLPVFGADGRVYGMNFHPPIRNRLHITWNGDPADPRVVLLTPDLEEVEDQCDVGLFDVVVEAMLEVG
jgi:hypothetical protein